MTEVVGAMPWQGHRETMSYRMTKTEHAGAKNGGGFWGYREEAKSLSRKARRLQSRAHVVSGVREYWRDSAQPSDEGATDHAQTTQE